ncbi:hypothetical protein GCU56_05490 [Geodermatophilus sabuli]|uniref:Antitoxin n=1 Tax=Geodermatophilus sabuli TaxID=1564158 RepID=A0A7K3VXE4_9ACTN|nr:hypothetical protein [Geodermatophilus sabuli]NEK57325.1 hypothetical protein [Geodermatophilus sabuli]
MASLFTKLTQAANNPKAKEAIRQVSERAQQVAKDPKTKAKIEDVRKRFQGGRGTGTGTGTTGH